MKMPPASLQALVSAKEANGDRIGIIWLPVGQSTGGHRGDGPQAIKLVRAVFIIQTDRPTVFFLIKKKKKRFSLREKALKNIVN